MTTAPIFAAARVTSHSGTTLPSTSSTRSPRRTPCSRSHPATWVERRDSSAKVSRVSPSAVTSHSAVWVGRSTASTPSNQSRAQLNSGSSGQRKPAHAAAGSSRCSSRKSRAARKDSVAVTPTPWHPRRPRHQSASRGSWWLRTASGRPSSKGGGPARTSAGSAVASSTTTQPVGGWAPVRAPDITRAAPARGKPYPGARGPGGRPADGVGRARQQVHGPARRRRRDPERVALALQYQHRHRRRGQLAEPVLVRGTRRAGREGQRDDGGGAQLGGRAAGDPRPAGPAAEHQRQVGHLALQAADRRHPGGVEHGRARRRAAAGHPVGLGHPGDRDAGGDRRGGDRDEVRRVDAAAGAVAEHQQRHRRAGRQVQPDQRVSHRRRHRGRPGHADPPPACRPPRRLPASRPAVRLAGPARLAGLGEAARSATRAPAPSTAAKPAYASASPSGRARPAASDSETAAPPATPPSSPPNASAVITAVASSAGGTVRSGVVASTYSPGYASPIPTPASVQDTSAAPYLVDPVGPAASTATPPAASASPPGPAAARRTGRWWSRPAAAPAGRARPGRGPPWAAASRT